mmetsp:Transcript_1838/g.5192  ORF Transcript_1838/g.5192 Transcript_1838/m.5192 type:complete len:284 (+) Transcript_1838:618-1469(+)
MAPRLHLERGVLDVAQRAQRRMVVRKKLNRRCDDVHLGIAGDELFLQPAPLLLSQHISVAEDGVPVVPRVENEELDTLARGAEDVSAVHALALPERAVPRDVEEVHEELLALILPSQLLSRVVEAVVVVVPSAHDLAHALPQRHVPRLRLLPGVHGPHLLDGGRAEHLGEGALLRVCVNVVPEPQPHVRVARDDGFPDGLVLLLIVARAEAQAAERLVGGEVRPLRDARQEAQAQEGPRERRQRQPSPTWPLGSHGLQCVWEAPVAPFGGALAFQRRRGSAEE